MIGLSRHTGRQVEGAAHLAQSIGDILTTPIGSRVMMREYGSDLPDVLDSPINGATQVDIFMAIAEALDRWEPRITLARIEVVDIEPGKLVLELTNSEGGLLPITLDEELAA